MAASVIDIEWRNQNALRNYPFREDCGLRPNDSAGNLIYDGLRIPNYLITDLVLCVSGTKYDLDIYLKRLSIASGIVTLTFADSSGTDAFTVSSSESNSAKAVTGLGSFVNANGSVCFGDLSRLADDMPDGLYTFSKDEALVEPTCIRPSADGINSLIVEDSSGYSSTGLQGDVKLIAGDNINIKYDPLINAIIISADPNSGYTDGCECQDDDQNVVRSINGIKTEDVTIQGDDCITITAADGVISIKDSCSKPCCGCAEVAFITQSINDLKSSVSTLTNNASVLSDRITMFVNNYLLARKTLS